ncbi:polyphosphate polymerase domain-containing protein [Faecalispora anaeroviscerum]|uniref:polyphosphate polymerase domain-containing protein n=1 Tax=Faecalispora anaeroviscerum TaxID=2991836 RepID=UPI0024BA297A|nr:polyphosphate polymerase domain-containing protein [Faecalispora anaeroviscerum]
MTQYQDVFKRYEKKYLMNQTQYAALEAELTPYMKHDQYGRHTICNLYLDTEDYRLIRMSLDKPVYKEKIRVRSYGVPQQGDSVFLELKKKYKDVVYKRRISLPLEETMDFLTFGRLPQEDSQIFEEIRWFVDFYRPVPKTFIGYDRVALFGRGDSELRITFDQNLRWRDTSLDLSRGDSGSPIIDPERVLMEIKVPGVMPLWLCRLMTELEIYPVSFSKYGTCYEEFLAPKTKYRTRYEGLTASKAFEKHSGGIICA